MPVALPILAKVKVSTINLKDNERLLGFRAIDKDLVFVTGFYSGHDINVYRANSLNQIIDDVKLQEGGTEIDLESHDSQLKLCERAFYGECINCYSMNLKNLKENRNIGELYTDGPAFGENGMEIYRDNKASWIYQIDSDNRNSSLEYVTKNDTKKFSMGRCTYQGDGILSPNGKAILLACDDVYYLGADGDFTKILDLKDKEEISSNQFIADDVIFTGTNKRSYLIHKTKGETESETIIDQECKFGSIQGSKLNLVCGQIYGSPYVSEFITLDINHPLEHKTIKTPEPFKGDESNFGKSRVSLFKQKKDKLELIQMDYGKMLLFTPKSNTATLRSAFSSPKE